MYHALVFARVQAKNGSSVRISSGLNSDVMGECSDFLPLSPSEKGGG